MATSTGYRAARTGAKVDRTRLAVAGIADCADETVTVGANEAVVSASVEGVASWLLLVVTTGAKVVTVSAVGEALIILRLAWGAKAAVVRVLTGTTTLDWSCGAKAANVKAVVGGVTV